MYGTMLVLFGFFNVATKLAEECDNDLLFGLFMGVSPFTAASIIHKPIHSHKLRNKNIKNTKNKNRAWIP